MNRRRLVAFCTITVTVVLALLISSQTALISAQNTQNQNGGRDREEPPPPPYNPYPPGILPPDLNSEIARVRREVRFIFNQALGEMRALPPLTITGQPPTLQGTGYQAVQTLGKLLNFDEHMSPFENRACAFCHMPYAGFSGPIPSVNLTMIAYPGSFQFRAGKRTAQRYTYSPRFPVLELYPDQNLLFGGNFWDGRSTGYLLQSADAEQAQHPPVDTQEHALPDTACIAFRLESAVYKSFFEKIWGDILDIRFPGNTEDICETPGGAKVFGTDVTPIRLSPEDRAKANSVYDHWGQSISFFEDSPQVSPFTSKVDANINGLPGSAYSPDELAGAILFAGKGNCNSCHIDGQRTTLAPGQTQTGTYPVNARPLFTCFGYSNLGLPLNPRDAFFYQTTPDFFGFTANPLGFGYRDLGLGTFLRSGFGSAPNPNSTWTELAPRMDGRHEKVDCWPMPEVPNNIDMTVGNLGLTDQEENQLVIIMQALNDGFDPANPSVSTYPNINTFTGSCMTCDPATDPNCSPSRQGNNFLIPTPTPLPPCATAVCGVPPLPAPKPIP